MGLAAFNYRRRVEAARKAAAQEAAAERKRKMAEREMPKSLVGVDPDTDFNSLTVRQLRDVADLNQIEIPASLTRKDDIVAFMAKAREDLAKGKE